MLPARTLTLTLRQAASLAGPTPTLYEVTVIPLEDMTAPATPDVALVGDSRTVTVTVTGPSLDVPFELVPTDDPSLTYRQFYRIGWRPKYFGRLTSYDFVMPDADINFDALNDTAAILGSETYVQQSDVGTRVATFNSDGLVVNRDGSPINTGGSAAAVQTNLDAEVLARRVADQQIQQLLESEIQLQAGSALTTATARINVAVSNLQTADLGEQTARQAAVADLNTTISGIQTTLNAQLATIASTVAAHTAALPNKADLVNGVLVTSQLPTLALTTAVAVADEAGMLGLTSTQVQPGDLAVRPDGTWLLLQAPPATLGNWIKTSTGGNVLSVNGQVGGVHLGAADVGAIAIGASITQAQVTGLSTALGLKADLLALTALTARVAAIENDTSIVRTTGGLILKAVTPGDSVYVNQLNQLVTKTGAAIPGGNGQVNGPGDVPGLVTILNGKVDTTDGRLTNARPPTAHAASHGTAGSDPITPGSIGARAVTVAIGQNEVTGLSVLLTNHGNRISSLETRVTDLESGSGGGVGGGSTSSAKTLWFDGTTAFAEVTNLGDFQAVDGVLQKGPWGQASDGTFYYNPAGAADGEWVWPSISDNGHLKLTKWDETAPADLPKATQASVTALTTQVNQKALASDLAALNTTVQGKASESEIVAINTTIQGLATTAALSSLTTVVQGKADASTVNGKANQSDLITLTNTVQGKADATVTTGLTSRVTSIEGALPNKADLDANGDVLMSQIPANIPQASIANLVANLAAKADQVAGKVPVAQIPTGIPQANITNLTTALSGKADLVGGQVPSSQLSSLALTTSVPVANRAALLALTTAQVQPGDLGIIVSPPDQGTYMLMSTDPSVFSNWQLLITPSAPVQSVNGQTGTVVLGPTDVNARSASTLVPLADVAGLSAALATYVSTATLTAGLATKTSPSDVNTLLSNATMAKQPARLVATVNVLSLSGQQSVDGILASIGDEVLLTAQSSSINNGPWIVQSGSWTRPTDYVNGTLCLRGTLIVVTGGTSANAMTLWQQTSASAIIGDGSTGATNWSKIGNLAAPPAFTNGNGLNLAGLSFSVKNTTGITVSASGVGVDHNLVPFKYAGDVPATGATLVTVTHNLGTTDLTSVTVMDKSSGTMWLIGWVATGVNTISLEFNQAPTAGQWRVVITA